MSESTRADGRRPVRPGEQSACRGGRNVELTALEDTDPRLARLRRDAEDRPVWKFLLRAKRNRVRKNVSAETARPVDVTELLDLIARAGAGLGLKAS